MYFTTKGIVLESCLVRERDRLVSVLTEDMGRLRAVAPGAEKISARLLGVTEPAVESLFTFYENSGNSAVAKITGGVILRTFPGLRCGFERFLLTSKVLEIVNTFMPEREPGRRKYILTARTLELLEGARNCGRIYRAFVLRFLRLCGWGLELDRCIKCGAGDAPVFSLKERGLMCKKCAALEGENMNDSLTGEPLLLLKKLSKKSGGELDDMNVSPEIDKIIADVVESYLLEYIPRPLKSGLFV